MPAIEPGIYREVWLAKLASPSTKYSFLIRDESSVKSGVVYGRTLRLGDPVSVGPNSTWQQNTWEGGRDQERWRDDAMFKSGNADTATTAGRIKLPPGLKSIKAEKLRGINQFIMCPGAQGYGSDTRLWISEANQEPILTDPTSGTIIPPTGYRTYYYEPSTGTVTTLVNNDDGEVTNLFRITDSGEPDPYIVRTTWKLAGNVSKFKFIGDGTVPTTNLILGNPYTETPAGTGPIQPNSVASYNQAEYYLQGESLCKRTWNGVSGGVHVVVKKLSYVHYLRALTVWNNRLWFCALQSGGHTTLFTSDGVTTVSAFEMHDGFVPTVLVGHKGYLFIAGYTKAGKESDGYIGEIWKYDGSRLTELWTQGTGFDTFNRGVHGACSWGRYFAWGTTGYYSQGDTPGVLLYDPEYDAISAGPSLDMPSAATGQFAVRGVRQYNNQLALSVWDTTSGYSGTLSKPNVVLLSTNDGKVRQQITASSFEGTSFENQPATLARQVLSSVYDGEPGTEADDKVWLTARVRVKIAAADSSIIVKATVNESTEYTLSTISYDGGNTGWRVVTIPIKSGGDYLTGQSIQYRFVLQNTSASSASTANPEVDNMSLDYMVKPKKRRQWAFRFQCQEGQLRLDGSANPLNTYALQRDKLEELWGESRPLLLWGPYSTGSASGDGIEVNPVQFTEQSFRVDSTAASEGGDISMVLVEVLTT